MSRILVTAAAAVALAVPGIAAAHGRVPPAASPAASGDPDRYGYCVLEPWGWSFLDLVKDQPLNDPTDSRWAYKTVRPANVGLDGNPLAIWC